MFFRTPSHCLESFDLDVFRAAISRDFLYFDLDLVEKVLSDGKMSIENIDIKDPIITLFRINKYLKKGFDIKSESLERLIDEIKMDSRFKDVDLYEKFDANKNVNSNSGSVAFSVGNPIPITKFQSNVQISYMPIDISIDIPATRPQNSGATKVCDDCKKTLVWKNLGLICSGCWKVYS